MKPTAKAKSEPKNDAYKVVDFKLSDNVGVVAWKVNNGPKRSVSPSKWSDRNGLKPGAFNAKEGANTLVAVDALGNQSAPFEFTLDTGKPTATLKDTSKRNPAGELIVADVKLFDNVLVASYQVNDGPIRNVTPNKWSDANGIAIDKNGGKQGKNVVTVRDIAGNIGTLEFTLVAADQVAPTVTNTAQVYEARQNGRIAVTVTFSEPVNSPGQGWYAVSGSNDTKWTKVYYSSKEYTVEFTDLVGNPGSTTFDVKDLKPAPEKPKPVAWGWSWNNHFGGGWLNNLLNNIFGGWRW